LKSKNFKTKSDDPRDRKESKKKLVSKFILVSIYTSDKMSIPLFVPLQKGEQKQFPLQGLMCHAWNIQAQTQLLELPKVDIWIFVFSREGLIPNHGYESRVKLKAI
jgi:hypothetical protein